MCCNPTRATQAQIFKWYVHGSTALVHRHAGEIPAFHADQPDQRWREREKTIAASQGGALWVRGSSQQFKVMNNYSIPYVGSNSFPHIAKSQWYTSSIKNCMGGQPSTAASIATWTCDLASLAHQCWSCMLIFPGWWGEQRPSKGHGGISDHIEMNINIINLSKSTILEKHGVFRKTRCFDIGGAKTRCFHLKPTNL